MYPNEARKKKLSYEGVMYANLTITTKETNVTVHHPKVSIGELPVMIGSCVCNVTDHNKIEKEECPNDPGGYFIIKGNERVLVSQLRPAYNKVYVHSHPGDKYPYVADMRTFNLTGNSILVQAKIDTKDRLFFSLPYIKDNLPAGLVFKAMGVSEDEMLTYVRSATAKITETLLDQYDEEDTIDAAVETITESLLDKDHAYVNSILFNELFYHIGFFTKKDASIHLGYILKKLIETRSGVRHEDDKDNLANKRLDTSNALITSLFQGLYKQFLKTVTNQITIKKNPDPLAIIRSVTNISHGMNMCFMTGNWSIQKTSSYMRVGVSQILSRQNYGATISHLRRLMLPIGIEGKNVKIRQLHFSHFSYIDPYETPEGATVGIVANLALTAEVSVDIPTVEIMEVVNELDHFITDQSGHVLVIVNGAIVGTTSNPNGLMSQFDEYRQSDLIDNQVSIVHYDREKEIHIHSDQGRLLRPLIRLFNNTKPHINDFESGIRENKIVFRDPIEIETATVAMNEDDLKLNKCDYLEISPAGTMMGVMSGVIPFSNHSQSPRIAYQSSMGKQAIGMPTLAFQYRYDTSLNVLDTPQKPITQSSIMNVLHYNEMSHGALPVIAIMTHGGFNQEDSIILNKASLERGLFAASTYKTITEEEKKRGNSDFETICAPKYEYRKRDYVYTHIDENGIVKKGTKVVKGDVIIGKTTTHVVKKDNSRVFDTKDTSIVIKQDEEGIIDSILDTTTNEGVRIVRIRIKINRPVEIGDKFASCTAQKGTCGMIYSQEDMPFDSKTGMTPDLIMNPHAIPSRMTINMLMEICFNLVGCQIGIQDATAFEHHDIEKDLAVKLKQIGWDSYTTTMCSGTTGMTFPSKIFMGPAFYQRLKHLVADKMHARMCGPLDTLTHQPLAGRAKDGGLRFGEMERDAILSQGSSRFLKECLFDKSDKYAVFVCPKCGKIPHLKNYCHACDEEEIEMKNMPYATKLLFQELMGMGIKLRFT
jgi:DNA-directed RNA polymerase II subunit RPB2